jgi:hypothetical protein
MRELFMEVEMGTRETIKNEGMPSPWQQLSQGNKYVLRALKVKATKEGLLGMSYDNEGT